MMDECPDHKCRESLILCLNKKVSKNVLLTVALGIIGVIALSVIYAIGADAKSKEKVATNTKDIAVIQVKIDTIEKTVKRIETKQMSKEDIVKAVKEAMGK